MPLFYLPYRIKNPTFYSRDKMQFYYQHIFSFITMTTIVEYVTSGVLKDGGI